MRWTKEQVIWTLLRVSMGWIFLWGFLDKTFGLGFATTPERAWLAGGSPTTGFLANAVQGPLALFFRGLAGSVIVDWLFMLGLLLIGSALLLGIGIRIAAYSGSLLMFLMWLALLLPENNPILDEHIIYILVLIGLSSVPSGEWCGLGDWWKRTQLVRKFPILR